MQTLNCKGKLLSLTTPLVMGILNATPDSFYKGAPVNGIIGFADQARKMIEEGASILDIGGRSTRPGSSDITVDEELQRVIPVIEAIHKNFPDIIISIDTFQSEVAKAAVDTGASMVNDVSGGEADPEMLATVATLRVPYVCMHMIGTPETMQQLAHYEDVTLEVTKYFVDKIHNCRKAGIKDIIIDPGFGFAKNAGHNFKLLKDLSMFRVLDVPILAGLSRKSTVYKTLGVTAEDALNGSTVLHTIALLNGANILRVHDVKEAVEAIKLLKAGNFI